MRSMFAPARHWRRVAAALVVVVATATAGAAAVPPQARATVTTLQKFTTPGMYVWTVPTGVTNVTFDVFGARGGSVLQNNHGVVTLVSSGGAGGEAKAKFAVTAGESFEIVVGGQGGSATLGGSAVPGGFNGGGNGAFSPLSAGGGGSSDVRIGGRGDNCVTAFSTPDCSIGARLVVGGGGGGGGNASGSNGDNGGGVTGTPGGCDSIGGGESGGQDCVGIGCNAGSFYWGARGCESQGDGGGGGGWNGGASDAHAGGGSGYISRFAKSGGYPGGTSAGDGKVVITTTT